MPSIPELLKDHVTLEVECLDRLYLNGYIGPLATPGGLVTFMRQQLGKPIPSPEVLRTASSPVVDGSCDGGQRIGSVLGESLRV